MIAGILKAVLELFGALAGYFRDRQLIDAGKAEASNENAQKTLDVIADVHRAIGDDERERVWNKLQAERRSKPRLPNDPSPGP